MRLLLLSLVTTLCGFSAGCLSADVGCVADSECYTGRVCVDGACTGDVPLNNSSPNNSAQNNENNGGPNNGGPNNGGPNNGGPNNGGPNNENNVQNNGGFNDVMGCAEADHCPGELVCSGDNVGVPDCVEPWRCDEAFEERFDDGCFMGFFCEEGNFEIFELDCQFGDADNGICRCFPSFTGEDVVFETSRDVCGDQQFLRDQVNLFCGWRLPEDF